MTDNVKGAEQVTVDVVVIGGSFAGISAALQIARARRPVLVIDRGLRRNRFADAAHGVLAQDGRNPAEIAAEAKAQFLGYPEAAWCDGEVVKACGEIPEFMVETKDGTQFSARRLILASGVVDVLPDVPGLRDRWGKTVFHCPYCHAYELGSGTLGILATMQLSLHQADVVSDWGRTILLTNGAIQVGTDERVRLKEQGIELETELVAEMIGDRADVRLRDGRIISLQGLFTLPHTQIANPVAEQLGCAFCEGPTGQYLAVDESFQTSAKGVYACGDLARGSGFVSTAIGDGALAGMAVHQSLIGPSSR